MNEIERLVLGYIGEDIDSPDVFDSTGIIEIRDSINDAIEEICMLTGSYKTKYQIPLYDGQAIYKIKMREDRFCFVSDCWDATSDRKLTQTTLTRLAETYPGWLEDSGQPQEYFQLGMDAIGFVPKPSGSGYFVELTVVAIPDRYTTDTDLVKVRDEFKWALVHYAVSEYWATRGDATEATQHFKRYLEMMPLKYPANQERYYGARVES